MNSGDSFAVDTSVAIAALDAGRDHRARGTYTLLGVDHEFVDIS